MKTMHLYRNLGVVAVGMMSMLATSCEEDIDNTVHAISRRLNWLLRVNLLSSMRANPTKQRSP